MQDLLFIFAAVVESGSLNRASARLNLSQPALSRKIAGLEEQLGVKLFERKGKRLELTTSGQLCYEYALELRRLQQRFLQNLMQFKTEKMYRITIGASLTTLQSTFPDLITAFTRQDPETDIKAVTGKTHEIVTLVKEQKVDLGLVASKSNQEGIVNVPLFDDHLSLVLPKEHPLAEAGNIEIGDLNQLPMILFSKGTWYRILTDELFHRYSIVPDVKMEIDSFEAIIRLLSPCRAGTLLPKSYLHAGLLKNNGLVERHIQELVQTTRTTTLIYSSSAVLSDAAKRFIQVAASLFGPAHK